MFEQSLFGSEEEKAPEQQEGSLFGQYEIKTWELSPRIYKILGASAIVNILALLIFAQTSDLTMKGCDSPLVGHVCMALDTVYVGALLFGTEREFADAAYDKTELSEMDITYVDVSNVSPKLYYPSDYMKYSDPERYAMMQEQAANPTPDFLAPGIPNANTFQRPQFGGGLSDTVPNPPKPKSDVVDGDLPTSIDDAVADSKPGLNKKRPGSGKVPTTPAQNEDGSIPGIPGTGTNPTINPNTQAGTENKDEAAPDQNGVYINKRPLKDKAKDTVAKVEANEIKLDSTFKVLVSGVLGLAKDGKTIVLKNPKPVPPGDGIKNDPKMEKFVQDWILAVGDAGWYGYIVFDEKNKVIGRKVLITIEQNDADFFASITAEQADENKAKSLSSGLGVILSAASDRVTGDEQTFIKAASATSDGKALILNIRMPKAQVQELIQRKLAEQKADPQKPSGNAATRQTDNTAKK